MAKKKVSSKKKKNEPILKRIDNIPNCSQQRRSSPPKRRTDFSLFLFCNSSSLSNAGSLLKSACVKLPLFDESLNSLCDGNAGGKELVVPRSKSSDEGSGFSSNVVEASIVQVELVNQDALLESCDDRKVGKLADDVLGILDFTRKKSSVAESKTICISPSSVVSTRCWSSEELSHISSKGLAKSIAASNDSDEQDLSSDKSSFSVSSRIEEGSAERGRGKRERKPKIHFDDVIVPLKPDRKVRRLRIMRYLGLTPPVGSPFLRY